MRPNTFEGVVNTLLHMLQIGDIDRSHNVRAYRLQHTTTEPHLWQQLIIQTLQRSVDALIEGKHYTYDQRLSPDKIRKLYKLFVRQVKQAKLDENMPDLDVAEIQEEALSNLKEVMALVDAI